MHNNFCWWFKFFPLSMSSVPLYRGKCSMTKVVVSSSWRRLIHLDNEQLGLDYHLAVSHTLNVPLAFESASVIVEQMSNCESNHCSQGRAAMVHQAHLIVSRKVWTASLEQMAYSTTFIGWKHFCSLVVLWAEISVCVDFGDLVCFDMKGRRKKHIMKVINKETQINSLWDKSWSVHLPPW